MKLKPRKQITSSQSDQLQDGLIAQFGRALQWYRRGHGLESCSSLNFFQVLILQLLYLSCVHIAAMINHTVSYYVLINVVANYKMNLKSYRISLLRISREQLK